MRRLAIIPARGGSKRIPRKNVRDFHGKPIIAYSIAAATASGLFSEVMVSTDDGEIGSAAERAGAKVPFYRSAANSDDRATTLDALREVLETYRLQGEDFDEVCCIYATSPFVTAELLRRGNELLRTEHFDCVFPVLRYAFPVQRSVTLAANGRMHLRHPQHLNARSQDLEAVYHDAGMFYWFRPEPVLAAQKLWTDNSGCLEVDALSAHDIDTPEDWEIAEFKYQFLRSRAQG